MKNKKYKQNILIVGNGKSGRMLAAKLDSENLFGTNLVGFVDDSKRIGEEIINGKTIIGACKDIKSIVAEKKINEILITYETDDYNKLFDLIELCQESNTEVKITSSLFSVVPQKIYIEKYGDIPLIDISPKYRRRVNLKAKRIFDFITASIGLFILSPLLIIIAAAIKFSSSGPVLFKQERIGKDGKPFRFYKFRSMYIENEDDEIRKQKMLKFMNGNEELSKNKKVISKDRVTHIGKILRKTSLDELPQLINVIKGEMSLVGPRPCLKYEYENYDTWQKKRVKVLPGCTGVWQVFGRSSVTFNDSIILDMYYVNNLSPWLDLQLILKTLPVMLFARGGE